MFFFVLMKCDTVRLVFQVEDLDFSSFLHCVVEVEDYNDHTPVFIPHFLSLAPLPEDVSVGTSVARLVASDSDSGQNREITYSLSEDSDPEGLFTIDQSGLLSVARPLDREKTAQYHLVVIATDHGMPALTGSATVQLPLLDVNDNGPEFEAAYSPVVFENVAGPQVGWTLRIIRHNGLVYFSLVNLVYFSLVTIHIYLHQCADKQCALS